MRPVKYVVLSALFLLTACGYEQSTAKLSQPISIALVKNDEQGLLRGHLAQKIAQSNKFRYSSSRDAKYELLIDVSTDRIETVGHSRGLGKSSGKLVPTQGNRFVAAKVKVIEKASGKEAIAPFTVSATVDFDFMNPATEDDIYWKTPSGEKVETLHYSYGQLDAKETAEKECQDPLFDRLSSQIVQALARASLTV